MSIFSLAKQLNKKLAVEFYVQNTCLWQLKMAGQTTDRHDLTQYKTVVPFCGSVLTLKMNPVT